MFFYRWHQVWDLIPSVYKLGIFPTLFYLGLMTWVWTVFWGGKPSSGAAVWHWVGNARRKAGSSRQPCRQCLLAHRSQLPRLPSGLLMCVPSWHGRAAGWEQRLCLEAEPPFLQWGAVDGGGKGSLRNLLSNRSGWAELFWGLAQLLCLAAASTLPVWHPTLLGLKWPYSDNVPWHGRLWMFCFPLPSNVLIAFKEQLGFSLF